MTERVSGECNVLFARVVTAAFAQRRKTLRNALSALCPADTLARVDIDPGARGETLAIADFARLANAMAAQCPAKPRLHQPL